MITFIVIIIKCIWYQEGSFGNNKLKKGAYIHIHGIHNSILFMFYSGMKC